MILRDSGSKSSPSFFFFHFGVKLTQDLVKFFRRHCFDGDIFKMATLTPASENIHPLFCGGDVFLFEATDLSPCISSLEMTGNLEISNFCGSF